MHLIVFGGTGGTGQQLIRTALASGHTVTAPARDPSRIRTAHSRLRIVRDVLDPASLVGTADGADAVVSALGVPDGRKPTTVYSTGVANVLDAMVNADVSRFIGVSAVPVTPRAEVGVLDRLVVYPILYQLFGEGYADMARMEQVLRNSAVEWTVVRPPRLTNRPATGHYRRALNRRLPRAYTISRADLAAAMLHLLEQPHTVRATVVVAN